MLHVSFVLGRQHFFFFVLLHDLNVLIARLRNVIFVRYIAEAAMAQMFGCRKAGGGRGGLKRCLQH